MLFCCCLTSPVHFSSYGSVRGPWTNRDLLAVRITTRVTNPGGLGFLVDPCLNVTPPCMGEADRFSLEALRHIHKQLDDDNDGGIEVNESVEVSAPCPALFLFTL